MAKLSLSEGLCTRAAEVALKDGGTMGQVMSAAVMFSTLYASLRGVEAWADDSLEWATVDAARQPEFVTVVADDIDGGAFEGHAAVVVQGMQAMFANGPRRQGVTLENVIHDHVSTGISARWALGLDPWIERCKTMLDQIKHSPDAVGRFAVRASVFALQRQGKRSR